MMGVDVSLQVLWVGRETAARTDDYVSGGRQWFKILVIIVLDDSRM